MSECLKVIRVQLKEQYIYYIVVVFVYKRFLSDINIFFISDV